MSDTRKVVDFITAALTPHRDTQVPFVFVHLRTAFQSCRFTHIRKPRFVEEVADALTSFDVVASVGTWVYTEFGDGFSMFVRVLSAADSRGLVGAASVINHLNQRQVSVNGQGIGVGLAFGADKILPEQLKQDESDYHWD